MLIIITKLIIIIINYRKAKFMGALSFQIFITFLIS